MRNARTIIANSNRTRADLIKLLGVPDWRVRTVYLGVDPQMFRPADRSERARIRRSLGWDINTEIIVFAGALSDRRKGFDILTRSLAHVCPRIRPGMRHWSYLVRVLKGESGG